jgi:NAD(P)-dependent dehydrogenase (short-subunit alcohol dehydrogenase family)
MSRFSGKVVVVVGGTSGMGRASAFQFADEEATVVVVGRRESKAEAVLNRIAEKGGKGSFIQADISRKEDCYRIIDTAGQRHGQIDVLLNMAGVSLNKGIEELTEEEWDFELDTNLKSYFLLCKQCVPFLKRTRGNIVNMSSMSGLIGKKNLCSYSASKAGIIGLTKNLAIDLAKYGIRANAICPGWIDSDMNDAYFQKQQESGNETRAQISGLHPFGRIGTSQEAASLITFLASDAASFITGLAVPIDGGLTLGYP